MKVGEIMSTKVVTVKVGTTIEEVARLLAEKNISGVPVVDEKGKLAGIVTHKDLLYKDMEPRLPAAVEILGGVIYLRGVHRYNEELKKLVATKVEDIMTKDVATAREDAEIEEVARLMVDRGVNRIPVVREGALVGIVGRADIVTYIARNIL